MNKQPHQQKNSFHKFLWCRLQNQRKREQCEQQLMNIISMESYICKVKSRWGPSSPTNFTVVWPNLENVSVFQRPMSIWPSPAALTVLQKNPVMLPVCSHLLPSQSKLWELPPITNNPQWRSQQCPANLHFTSSSNQCIPGIRFGTRVYWLVLVSKNRPECMIGGNTSLSLQHLQYQLVCSSVVWIYCFFFKIFF